MAFGVTSALPVSRAEVSPTFLSQETARCELKTSLLGAAIVVVYIMCNSLQLL